MSESVYDIGQVVVVEASFRDPKTKKLVDPQVVVATFLPPGAKPSDALTPGVEKVKTGVYKASVQVDRAGRWWVAWDGAGLHPSAGERSFMVRERRVPR